MAAHGRHKSSAVRERQLPFVSEVWKHPWNTNTEEFYEWFFDFDDGLFIFTVCPSMEYDCSALC